MVTFMVLDLPSGVSTPHKMLSDCLAGLLAQAGLFVAVHTLWFNG